MQVIRKNDSPLMKTAKRFVFVTVGAFIVAFNLNSFVNTGGIFPGGFSGVTLLIRQIAERYLGIYLPFTAVYIPINLIPIYIGIKHLGKHFTIFSIYLIVLSSILTDILPTVAITYDNILISIFGGLLNGMAICLCLFVGASAGGTDFISIYMSEKKGIDAWNYIFLGNVVILTTAGILFGFDRALYSIIFQFTTTQVIYTLFKRYQKQTLLIITERPDHVYERIRSITNHDATIFKGIGCYKQQERDMLYSVVSSEEVRQVIPAIKDEDPKAFINVLRTDQIQGRFYKKPND